MSLRTNALIALHKYEEESGRQLPDDDRRIREYVGRRYEVPHTGQIVLCDKWEPPADGGSGWFSVRRVCPPPPGGIIRNTYSGMTFDDHLEKGVFVQYDDPMIKGMAELLLVDAIASEANSESTDPGSLSEEHPYIDWLEISGWLERSQENICDTVPGTFKEYGLSLDPFLPLDLVEEIVAECNKFWGSKLSIEELYEYDEKAAHDLILQAVGHGVSPNDDPNIAAWIREHGVEVPRLSYYESPYDEAYMALDALATAIGQAEG